MRDTAKPFENTASGKPIDFSNRLDYMYIFQLYSGLDLDLIHLPPMLQHSQSRLSVLGQRVIAMCTEGPAIRKTCTSGSG
jgi:hypothetical protein